MPMFSGATCTRRARRDARHEVHPKPLRDAIQARKPGRILIECSGQRFDLELRPDPRASRRWYAFRDGEPFKHGGLEQIWRAVQRQMSPVMSASRLS